MASDQPREGPRSSITAAYGQQVCHTDQTAEEEPVRHRWEDWTWDETVFEGTAAYYRRGRKPYAPALAHALAEHLPLDGHGRLLDVGCGPGTVALNFALLFEGVVGLDPDPAMLEEAERAASEQHVTKATWVHMRAEDLPGSLDTFRVITFGQSFHWMDRSRVAGAVRSMLDPGGAPWSRSTSGTRVRPARSCRVDLAHHSPKRPSTSYGCDGSDPTAGRAKDFATPRPMERMRCSRPPASRRRKSSWYPTIGSSNVLSTTSWHGYSPPRRQRRTSSESTWVTLNASSGIYFSPFHLRVGSAFLFPTIDCAFTVHSGVWGRICWYPPRSVVVADQHDRTRRMMRHVVADGAAEVSAQPVLV